MSNFFYLFVYTEFFMDLITSLEFNTYTQTPLRRSVYRYAPLNDLGTPGLDEEVLGASESKEKGLSFEVEVEAEGAA